MKKLCLLFALLGGFSQAAKAQANNWTILPDFAMDASTGSISQFTAASNIAACTANYAYHRPGVLSNPSTGNYYALNGCGFFDNAGNVITFPGHGNAQMYEVPTNCDEFFTAGWKVTNHGSGMTYEFILSKYSKEEGSFDHISDNRLVRFSSESNMNINYAVSRLEPGGWRRIFITHGDNFEIWDISPTGAAMNSYAGPLRQSSGGLLADYPDNRMNMEVSADGRYLIYVTVFGTNYGVHLYDFINNSNSMVGYGFPSTDIISGFEYVPESVLGAGQTPRVYISYHEWLGSTGNLVYYEVGSPTQHQGLASGTPNKPLYGFSEIELAKTGELYLAYNASGNQTCAVPGELTSVDMAGNVNTIIYGGNPVPVKTYWSNWGYIIQNQIDGENYSRACDPEGCKSDFSATIDTRYPYTVNFGAWYSGPYEWEPEAGQIVSAGSSYTHNYPTVNAAYNAKLKIVHPWDHCVQGLSFCLNGTEKRNGDPAAGNVPCNQSSDFILGLRTDGTLDVDLQPISGSEPYYYITWGDGASINSSSPMSFIYSYSTPGTYKVCMQTGVGTNCKTCMEVCIPEGGTMEGDGSGKKYSNSIEQVQDNIQALSLYPNPAGEQVNIEMTAGNSETISIKITDLAGKVSLMQEKAVTKGKNSFTISLNNIPSGVYVLTVSGQNQTLREKLIKQ